MYYIRPFFARQWSYNALCAPFIIPLCRCAWYVFLDGMNKAFPRRGRIPSHKGVFSAWIRLFPGEEEYLYTQRSFFGRQRRSLTEHVTSYKEQRRWAGWLLKVACNPETMKNIDVQELFLCHQLAKLRIVRGIRLYYMLSWPVCYNQTDAYFHGCWVGGWL